MISKDPHDQNKNSAANYIEGLCDVSWYTADPKTPYLVKAAATQDNGYKILITDLKNTYFCSGDAETIKNEKKVEKYSLYSIEIQSNN